MPNNFVGSRERAAGRSLSQTLMAGTAIGTVFTLALAYPAFAQESENRGGPAGVIEIPTISVEADSATPYKVEGSASQKFTAPLIDTPKSVTVIPEEVIEERNATSLDEVLRTVPGITLGAGEGGVPSGDLPNIRGFASEGNIYVDGLRNTGSQTRDMFNLEQVEVVKGPGSAFAGRGSTGGSINLVTKKARSETFFESSVSAGYPLSGRATVDGNYVLSDSAAIRLNLLAEDSEVAGRDEVTTSSLGFAPSLALGLGSDTRATISLYHLQTDDMPDYGHPYDPRTGKPADVDRDNFYGLVDRDFQETQVDAATLELEHDIEDGLMLRNVTRYSWSENDYIVTNPDDSAGNVANGMVWRNVKSRNSDTTVITNQTDLSGEAETWSLKHSFNAGVWGLAVFVIVSFTGVYIAFPQTFSAAFSALLGQTGRVERRMPDASGSNPGRPLEALAAAAQEAVGEPRLQSVVMPFRPGQGARARFSVPGAAAGAPTIQVELSPADGRVLTITDPRSFGTQAAIAAWQRPLHEGAGLGPVWRFLVFVSGLLPLVFSITGVAMWLIKRKARRASTGGA